MYGRSLAERAAGRGGGGDRRFNPQTPSTPHRRHSVCTSRRRTHCTSYEDASWRDTRARRHTRFTVAISMPIFARKSSQKVKERKRDIRFQFFVDRVCVYYSFEYKVYIFFLVSYGLEFFFFFLVFKSEMRKFSAWFGNFRPKAETDCPYEL